MEVLSRRRKGVNIHGRDGGCSKLQEKSGRSSRETPGFVCRSLVPGYREKKKDGRGMYVDICVRSVRKRRSGGRKRRGRRKALKKRKESFFEERVRVNEEREPGEHLFQGGTDRETAGGRQRQDARPITRKKAIRGGAENVVSVDERKKEKERRLSLSRRSGLSGACSM